MTESTRPDPLDPDRFAPGGDGRINRAASLGFERGAGDYEAARPSYPPEAVALLVRELGLAPGRRVLDLGAGTGKLARLLVPSGASVVAIEPVAAMRAELAANVPGVEVLDGRAEDLPLGDASVDAVAVAQAFHWFDAPVALGEVHRVLRPGGRLALVWNVRDESVDWVRRFGEILVDAAGAKPYEQGVDWAQVVADAGGFSPVEQAAIPYRQPIDADTLVRRAASTSFVSALPDDRRERCLAEVRTLARTHPQLAGRSRFDFPHRTTVLWCERR